MRARVGRMVIVVLGAACSAMAQDAAMTYAKMAPVEQYLMADRDAEIALAKSAVPEAIARDAEVRVLGPHGFVTAVKGSNGFVCIVGRSWTAAADRDFWDPNVRVPMCVNAAGARSYLVRMSRETEWGLAGKTPAQIGEAVIAGLAKKELPAMEPGAMCYMMSKQGYGGKTVPHWPSHLMFFYTDMDTGSWGANLPGSPVIGIADPTEHLTQFVVVVQHWSDRTEFRVDPGTEHHHP